MREILKSGSVRGIKQSKLVVEDAYSTMSFKNNMLMPQIKLKINQPLGLFSFTLTIKSSQQFHVEKPVRIE